MNLTKILTYPVIRNEDTYVRRLVRALINPLVRPTAHAILWDPGDSRGGQWYFLWSVFFTVFFWCPLVQGALGDPEPTAVWHYLYLLLISTIVEHYR